MQKFTIQKDLGCRLKCQNEDTQYHIFKSCQPICFKLGLKEASSLIHIYVTPVEQKNANKYVSDCPNKGTTRTKLVNM